MIDPKTLMQGNIIKVGETGRLVKVVMINDVNIDVVYMTGKDIDSRHLFSIDQLEPVKLSSSILPVLGFWPDEKSAWKIELKNGNGLFRLLHYDGANIIDSDNQFIFLNLCIEYVHHLQNIFFVTQGYGLDWNWERMHTIQIKQEIKQ